MPAAEGAERRPPAPRPVTRGESPFPAFSIALDWLSFTFQPRGAEQWKDAVRHFLKVNFGLVGWEERGGFRGYQCSARVDGAIVAWGGEAQRGTVYVDLSGQCLGECRDWQAVVEWLEVMEARLRRVDIAGDDFFASEVSMEWGREQLRDGGFITAGRRPTGHWITHCDDGVGNTLYVGKRENGKMCRIYEKGKQLGDAVSKWCRFEVEWRAKDRILPFDMLLRPAEYLAGSYPCAAFFSSVTDRVRSFKSRAVLSYQKVIAIARLHAGRVVNMVLDVTGGDIGEVVSLLRRAGLPSRINRAELACLRGT